MAKVGQKPRPFESFLVPGPNGCIEWGGVKVRSNGRDSHRYGRLTRDGKKHLVHRVAFERAHGPIPDGMNVLHRCDNTSCCNPEHLFLGTQRDNMRDMSAKGRGSKIGGPRYRGEQAPGAKLTDHQVAEIRSRRAQGETTVALGLAYSVHSSHVSRIARGLIRK